jgi:hypothetical protein
MFTRTSLMFLASIVLAVPVSAQAQQEHKHDPAAAPQPAGQHQHETPAQGEQAHQHAAGGSLFAAREASGTAWVPEATPMYALHGRAGAWELMWHGNAFLQLLHEEAEDHRGGTQGGSINWLMGMARRNVGNARLGVRTMISLEPATIGGCGYPDLLATGELCDGDSIHDLQHPHDFLMELALDYERSAGEALRWQVYAGLAGEPALGPVAYPHRLSAMPNPIAPIAHHWLDATHITYGVVTAGLFGPRFKVEASVFNGREPDEDRWDVDLAPLDSFSGRFSFAPTPSLAVQFSVGHLNEAEAEVGGASRIDVGRVTASVTYHRQQGEGSYTTAMLGWGRNKEHGEITRAAIFEVNVTRRDRHAWFGRAEIAGKPAHDLHVHESTDIFTVAKLQAGYTRYFAGWAGLAPGIGGAVSAGVVPPFLAPRYGNRVNPGFAIFLTVRPGAHRM